MCMQTVACNPDLICVWMHAARHLPNLLQCCECMQAIARDCYGVLSQEAGEAAADLSSARRLLSTASEPLVALGKHLSGVLLQSLGSTTAFALTGSVGVVRLGVGKLFMLVLPARSLPVIPAPVAGFHCDLRSCRLVLLVAK